MIVVADASPIRYLIVIGEIRLLPALYGTIVLPSSVRRELSQPATPESVSQWIDQLPGWVKVRAAQRAIAGLPPQLGAGEREAIALAEELHADVLLADDEAARDAAQIRGIPVQGILGVLDLAATHGLLTDLPGTIEKLQATNFRVAQRLVDFILSRHGVS